MKTALFIGRFQPFHLGHLDAIRQILNDFDNLIIAVGSSQYSGTDKNPFSYKERETMITRVLKFENINNFKIYPVEDTHDNNTWVDHVESIVPDFHVVFSMNDLVRRLFSEKGRSVLDIRFNIHISATEIRRKISKKDASWKKYIHASTAEILGNK